MLIIVYSLSPGSCLVCLLDTVCAVICFSFYWVQGVAQKCNLLLVRFIEHLFLKSLTNLCWIPAGLSTRGTWPSSSLLNRDKVTCIFWQVPFSLLVQGARPGWVWALNRCTSASICIAATCCSSRRLSKFGTPKIYTPLLYMQIVVKYNPFYIHHQIVHTSHFPIFSRPQPGGGVYLWGPNDLSKARYPKLLVG